MPAARYLPRIDIPEGDECNPGCNLNYFSNFFMLLRVSHPCTATRYKFILNIDHSIFISYKCAPSITVIIQPLQGWWPCANMKTRISFGAIHVKSLQDFFWRIEVKELKKSMFIVHANVEGSQHECRGVTMLSFNPFRVDVIAWYIKPRISFGANHVKSLQDFYDGIFARVIFEINMDKG